MRGHRQPDRGKFLGGMVGSALGDAIGEMAFVNPDKKTLDRAIDRQVQLVYTDDTAMALGLAESLIDRGDIDQQHLGDTFRQNYEREPWRGYASGPPAVFSAVKKMGIPYPEAARRLFGGGSFGNGAAMRIAPLGLFFAGCPDLRNKACLSAEVTHAHAVGMDGAAVQARAVALAVLLGASEDFPQNHFMDDLIRFSRTDEIRQKMMLLETLVRKGAAPEEAALLLGQSVAVQESMPFAVYAFLRSPGSFEDCLYCSVLNGGDLDTLGAMACALSGAYLGIDAIPLSWRRKLENGSRIEALAEKLWDRRREKVAG